MLLPWSVEFDVIKKTEKNLARLQRTAISLIDPTMSTVEITKKYRILGLEKPSEIRTDENWLQTMSQFVTYECSCSNQA